MSRPERKLQPGRSALDRFGFELRKWRKSRGLSQDRLGLLVHVSGDLIQRVEVGQRRPGRDLAKRCDEVLSADGALLGVWDELLGAGAHLQRVNDNTDTPAGDTDNHAGASIPDAAPGTMILPAASLATGGIAVALSETTEGGPGDDLYSPDRAVIPCRTEDGKVIWVSVPRRGFLLAGIGAAASAASAVSGIPVGRRNEAARMVAKIHAAAGAPFERFEAMRELLRDSDNLFGPAQAMRLVHEQLIVMDELRKGLRGADYRQLLRVEVQFADLLAWLYQDSGKQQQAQYWLGRALDWSHISGDPGTIAFILARKSQLAGQFQDGAEAVDVAEAARRESRGSGRSAVIAETYAAHGYALRGEKTSCLRSYDHAQEMLAGATSGPSSWYGNFLDRAYIEVQRAHSLSAIGDYGRAAASFDVALSELPGNYYRDRGVYLARKSLAHAGAARTGKNGADEQAAAAACSGLEALAIGVETGSARIHSELTRARAKIDRWHRLPEVEEFVNAMRHATPLLEPPVSACGAEGES